MARAYVIHIKHAEFRISGNKTEVAELLFTIFKNTEDAMKYRGRINEDYWNSEECADMASLAVSVREEARRIAPDYFGKDE